jgi:microcin C transport system permease protein
MSTVSASPTRRAWLRFKRNRLGYWSLVIFCVLVVLSLFAELLSNDKPLVVRYNGQLLFPIVNNVPETKLGGDFETQADYLDPFIREQLAKPGNFAVFPLNEFHHSTLNYFSKAPNPAPPSAENWLGTDDRGRDLVARLIYGFRVSVLFALALTAIGVVLGVITGAIQGYFAGSISPFSASLKSGAPCPSCIC